MSLIGIVVVLCVVGILLWAMAQLPIDSTIQTIIRVLVIVVVLIWLLQVFGLLGPIGDIRVR
jgi:hypothetical protein